jgi:hypothetical protein
MECRPLVGKMAVNLFLFITCFAQNLHFAGFRHSTRSSLRDEHFLDQSTCVCMSAVLSYDLENPHDWSHCCETWKYVSSFWHILLQKN